MSDGREHAEVDEERGLRVRTKTYALLAIRFYCKLPAGPIHQIIGKQFVRSATSVGAHHREAHRARSSPEFISKMELGAQELDESLYWLEILDESGLSARADLEAMMREGHELLAMFVASIRTAKNRHNFKKEH